eukprot:jgi/Orpsp1_1/1190013/evm.model.d7180000076105.1
MFNNNNSIQNSPIGNNMFSSGVQIEEVSANYEEEEEKKKEIEKLNEEIARLEAEREDMIRNCKPKISQLNQQLQKLISIEEKYNLAIRDYNTTIDNIRRLCDEKRNYYQNEVNKYVKKDENSSIQNKAQELLAQRMQALGLNNISTISKGNDNSDE